MIGYLYRKEMNGFFSSPFGMVYIGIFLLISGIVFSTYNLLGMRGDMNGMFGVFANISIMTFPILTMRQFAEERNNGTEQLLLTSRLRPWEIVVGKFMASLSLFGISLAATLCYVLILMRYGSPNLGAVAGSYFGFFMLGMAFTAISLFAASLTENQVTAAISSFGILFFTVILGSLAKATQVSTIKSLLSWFSITVRYEEFTRGIFRLGPIVYYLCFSMVFIYLTVKNLEKRQLD